MPLIQAYDVILCFQSIIPWLGAYQDNGVWLLKYYFQLADSPEVLHAIRKITRFAGWIRHLEPFLGPLPRKHKDVDNTLRMARALTQL